MKPNALADGEWCRSTVSVVDVTWSGVPLARDREPWHSRLCWFCTCHLNESVSGLRLQISGSLHA